MKITSIDVMKIPSPDVSFSGNGGGSTEDWSPIIVRINTDEGITGFGEAGLAYGKGWRAGFGMGQDFAHVIIGEDPMNIERYGINFSGQPTGESLAELFLMLRLVQLILHFGTSKVSIIKHRFINYLVVKLIII